MSATTVCQIYYGKEKIPVAVPTENLIGVIEPREASVTQDESSILEQVLENPIGLPPLKELAKRGQKVAIVVDDNTRPTPTHKMLPLILAELETAGVQKDDITIVFANGSHRLQTREEQARLVGEEVMANYRVTDHNPHDKSTLTYLGQTSRGTPVHINHYVAEADLRILTGLIKPHCEAGYSGGGKAILPGVSSIETIISDHNYEANANPNAVFGVIDGNPIRSDIEDAAHLVEPCFILNVILDKEKRIVDAVAGEMIKAHRVGTQKLDRLVRVAVPEVADIVIAGCSYPTSVSLYQAANAALACTRLVHPIVKKGGIIILKQVGGQVAIRGTGTGPFSLASHLIGTQRFLEELVMASVEPEGEAAKALRHLLELTSDALIDFAKAEVDAGADIVQAGDSLASIDGISPRMYQEWAWPYEKKFFDALNKYAQERKVMTLLHVCGNMTPVLSLMADTGAMILELDYKVDKVDLAVNKAAVGDRVCLMGNLNPAELLLRGTAADVTAESQRCIDAAGKGSGFILGSGCELAYYTPQENVKAMIRMARQNHYPL